MMTVLKIILIIIGLLVGLYVLLWLAALLRYIRDLLHERTAEREKKQRALELKRFLEGFERVPEDHGCFYLSKDKKQLAVYINDPSFKDITLRIPDGVETIWDGALRLCDRKAIKKVILPEGLRDIGDHAFEYCENLKSVKFPAGLERIGKYAFSVTSINEIDLSRGIKTIDDSAFYTCRADGLILPDENVTIGDGVFEGTNIYSFSIAGTRYFLRRSINTWDLKRLLNALTTGRTDGVLYDKLRVQAAVQVYLKNGSEEEAAYARENMNQVYKYIFEYDWLKEASELLSVKPPKELAIKMSDYAQAIGSQELFLMMVTYRNENGFFDDSTEDRFEL